MLTVKHISYVSKSNLFNVNSQFFGYTPAKVAPFSDELFKLLDMWETQGFVEIYDNDADRKWGRLKSSAYDGQGHPIPAYAYLYHGRVQDDSTATTAEERKLKQDPLIVVSFQPEPTDPLAHPVLVAEFVLKHDQYIGRIGLGKAKKNVDGIRSGVRKRTDLSSGKFTKI